MTAAPKAAELLYRTFTLDRKSMAPDSRTFTASVASETPVERYFGYEVIPMRSAKLDFFASGSAPLLLDHDPTKQIGVIESARVDGTKLRVKARFGQSPLAQEIHADILDGIRSSLSIGYGVSELVRTGQNWRARWPAGL